MQERVDVFVVSLPLGTTPHDAEIEEKVAERLYDDEIAAAAVRSQLSEWCAIFLATEACRLLDRCTAVRRGNPTTSMRLFSESFSAAEVHSVPPLLSTHWRL